MLVTKLSGLAVKNVDEGTGLIEGYASTFGNIDSYGDTIAPGAFTATLQQHAADGTTIPLLFEHDRDLGAHVGQIVEASEDSEGLFIRAQLDVDDEAGAKALRLAKGRRITGLSIGFMPVDIDTDIVDDTPVTRINEIDLREVSLVLNPADAAARVTSVKSADPELADRLDRREKGAEQVAGLLKSLQSDEGPDALAAALDTIRTKAANGEAAGYLAALTGHDIPAHPTFVQDVVKTGLKLDDATRTSIEKKAAEQILTKARAEHRGLTDAERDLLDLPRTNAAKREKQRRGSAVLERSVIASRLSKSADDVTDDEVDAYMRGDYGPRFNTEKDHSKSKEDTMHTNRIPLTTAARADVARRAADEIQTKAATTSGSLTVPTQDAGITDIERPGNNILGILPDVVQTTPNFSYLRQSARELNAGRVPVGEEKPETNLKFERVDAELEVVAHVVRGIDEYILKDVTDLSGFIQNEMITGVLEAVEAWTVEALAAAEGRHHQDYDADVFTTARLGINQLQATGLTPAAIILSPSDWARAETAKATGSGSFLFNSAPVDQTNGTLWGVPVVTSHRLADGTGYVIADGTAEIHHDGQISLAYNSSGEEFARNQITFRAESRYCPVIKRETGIVELDLDGTGNDDQDGDDNGSAEGNE